MDYGLIAESVTGVIAIVCMVINVFRLEKKDSNYKKYINSIKVGDTFELNLVKDLPEDPFDRNSLNHTGYQCVITDIKKNTVKNFHGVFLISILHSLFNISVGITLGSRFTLVVKLFTFAKAHSHLYS